MSAVVDLFNILQQANFSWIDHIYKNLIPEEHLDDSDSTDCLLTASESSPTTYGDNTFTEVNETVEIRLFYSSNFSNPDDCEITLLKAILDAGWSITSSDARYTDPDTGQAIKAIYVSHNKLLGGS